MTDFSSDKEIRDCESGKPQEGNASEKAEAFDIAIHIAEAEPHDPGTLFVAVAEPEETFLERQESGDQENVPPNPSIFIDSSVTSPNDKCSGQMDLSTDIPEYGDLVAIAAVRLNGLGPALFFLARDVICDSGDAVIATMEEGQVYGTVASALRMHPDHLESLQVNEDGAKLRPLVRKATDKDRIIAVENETLSSEALTYCRQCIRERNLDMKLVDVLVLHDRSKMVFYFTAPARIDFRELVKDLVRRYRTRIELRQIGVRHETQMVGALGNCGMVCCCRRYLRKFAPVAIKMAKEQNVFLNPVKISGICGRLLCCLSYEQQHYDEFYRSCPKLGKKYHTDSGVYRVLRASLFNESVTVLSETGEEIEFPLAEWDQLNPNRPNAPQQGQSGKKQDGRKENRAFDEEKHAKGTRKPTDNARTSGNPRVNTSVQAVASRNKIHESVSEDSSENATIINNSAKQKGPLSDTGVLSARSLAEELSNEDYFEETGSSDLASETERSPQGQRTYQNDSPAQQSADKTQQQSDLANHEDEADDDDFVDGIHDGGSIFGLAPHRDNTGEKKEKSDNNNSHKRHRRQGRKKT